LNGNANLIKSLESLAQRLYAITNLQNIELTGLEITGVIGTMNERYAERLGIDPVTIEKAHLSEAAKLRQRADPTVRTGPHTEPRRPARAAIFRKSYAPPSAIELAMQVAASNGVRL
jgi:hypothetical protein